MKIAILSATKNEEDIIESFVRHNCRFCDAMFIMDASTDRTKSILNNLKDEGFPVDFINEQNEIYIQQSVMTSALNYLAGDFDWLLILDADEFIACDTRDRLSQSLMAINPNMAGAMNWKTFVPITANISQFDDPILQGFLPRSSERPQFSKICVSGFLGRTLLLDPGSHSARLENGQQVSQVKLPYYLAHYPVRSSPQIIRKSILAEYSLRLKPNLLPGEGAHVFTTAQFVRDRLFDLKIDDLQWLALQYAMFEDTGTVSIDDRWTPWTSAIQRNIYTPTETSADLIAALDHELLRLTAILKTRI